MVSGALLLLFVVAFWNWTAGLSSVLLVQVVTNITFSGTEVGVTVKPAKIIQFSFLFFGHVMHPSGSELEQTGFRRPLDRMREVQIADFAAVAEIAVDHHQPAYHPTTA